MASEKGPVATEAPLVAPPTPATVSAVSPAPSLEALASDSGRIPSLKRHRESSPDAPTTGTGGATHPELSPSKIARLVGSTRFSPGPPLTGQIALEDELHRREEEARLHPPDAISENPAQQALSLLRGAEAPMSGVTAAAPATAAAAAEAATTKNIDPVLIPSTAAARAEPQSEASPGSATSPQSAQSPPGGSHVVHSPAPMDVDARNDRPSTGYTLQPEAQMEKPGSMSYPGLLPPDGTMPAPPPPRGMSLPMSSSQNAEGTPRSPSSKKHKCPFCDTEFTRHHNLKSHLLTHSQEKPYVCHDCQMRFRRLHDLKRHSKLHTGEKPHVCPKCERKFARGDALARHSKGAGGCAGRRASMGSFPGEDDYDGAGGMEGDDSAMAGVIYEGNEPGMTEEERRRLSMPNMKAPQTGGGQAPGEGLAPHSRTYPPAGPRPSGASGGLFPPGVDRGAAAGANTSLGMSNNGVGGSHAANTGVANAPMGAAAASLYSHHGMTESPKPLSPSGGLQPGQAGHDSANTHRARSPSLATQLQQQQLGRRASELTSPHAGTQVTSAATIPANAPQVPAMSGAHSRTSSGPTAGQSGGSGDSSANLFSTEHGLWAYIQTLEERLKGQNDKLRQQDELLRQQTERIAMLESGFESRMLQLARNVEELRNAVSASSPSLEQHHEQEETQPAD